jgi:hypothetical protein
MKILENLGFDNVNEMIIQEVITGLLGHIEDKEMIKEKAHEGLKHIDKLPDNMVVIITKLNGRVNASITEQTNIEGFEKEPEFIDIQAVIENIVESL